MADHNFQPGDIIKYRELAHEVTYTRQASGIWERVSNASVGNITTRTDAQMSSTISPISNPDYAHFYTYIPVAPIPEAPDLFVSVQSEITLPENFQLNLEQDKAGGDRWYFQIACHRRDVDTGEMGWGRGGKAYLSEHATLSELVQTAFGLYKSYVEHEARETFQWQGRRVFGPHMDVRAVWAVANNFDLR